MSQSEILMKISAAIAQTEHDQDRTRLQNKVLEIAKVHIGKERKNVVAIMEDWIRKPQRTRTSVALSVAIDLNLFELKESIEYMVGHMQAVEGTMTRLMLEELAREALKRFSGS